MQTTREVPGALSSSGAANEQASELTLAALVEQYMGEYTGRDRLIASRLERWVALLGDRAVSSLSDDDVFHALERIGNAPAELFFRVRRARSPCVPFPWPQALGSNRQSLPQRPGRHVSLGDRQAARAARVRQSLQRHSQAARTPGPHSVPSRPRNATGCSARARLRAGSGCMPLSCSRSPPAPGAARSACLPRPM